MRILVATDQWFPDLFGGVARVAAETSARLAERGHRVTVLAPRSAAGPPESVEGGLTVHRVLPRGRLPQTLTDVAATARAARRAAGAEPFDVALAHQTTTAVGLSAARLGTPLVLVFHASAPREVHFVRSRLESRAGRLSAYGLETTLAVIERTALRSASQVLVLSEYSRTLLGTVDAETAGRAVNVGGGVDVDLFRPGDGLMAARARLGIDVPGRLLFTVRRLEPRMGIEQLLEAMAMLGPVRSPHLAVAGSGSQELSLRRLSNSLGLDTRVRFLGRVSDPELRDWYRAADLFVLPTVAYEGFGLVTAEALASGTPVVGTPVGATPELLVPLEPRLLARDATAAALADALVEALRLCRPDLRRRCREYACLRLAWGTVLPAWERALSDAATPTFDRRPLDVPAAPPLRSKPTLGA